MDSDSSKSERRSFLKKLLQGVAGFSLLGLTGLFVKKSDKREKVWQIDPSKCIQCGRCETDCVLDISAVKCVHAYDVCGYCELCGGYFKPDAKELNTGAENQLCPTGAIKRTYVEDPYYEYAIDEDLCIGCGVCVKGCAAFGNGSLYLQIRHNLCINCNECRIAENCPADAFVRVSADDPYLLKGSAGDK